MESLCLDNPRLGEASVVKVSEDRFIWALVVLRKTSVFSGILPLNGSGSQGVKSARKAFVALFCCRGESGMIVRVIDCGLLGLGL